MSIFSNILRKRRRGAVGIEGAMALPVFLVLFGAVSQVMITGQSRVHLEQAAYAAARSALVHKCPPFNIVARLRTGIGGLLPTECDKHKSRLDRIAQQKAEDAARWALIAAAPTTGMARGRGCPDAPLAGEQILTGSNRIQGRDQAARNALCYVYEPGNVTVTLQWEQSLMSQIRGDTDVPITAEVEFLYPLSTPFRRFIYDQKRGDGTYWKRGSATVTLL